VTQRSDPVVEELRHIREQQAAQPDYDLTALFERVRRHQRQSKRKTVSFADAASSDKRPERQAALSGAVAS
jgi:hypothetical protein